jgi:hypothetical protein
MLPLSTQKYSYSIASSPLFVTKVFFIIFRFNSTICFPNLFGNCLILSGDRPRTCIAFAPQPTNFLTKQGSTSGPCGPCLEHSIFSGCTSGPQVREIQKPAIKCAVCSVELALSLRICRALKTAGRGRAAHIDLLPYSCRSPFDIILYHVSTTLATQIPYIAILYARGDDTAKALIICNGGTQWREKPIINTY